MLLYWCMLFFIIAVLGGLLGFGQIAGIAMLFAQVAFVLFLAVLILSVLAGPVRRRRGRRKRR